MKKSSIKIVKPTKPLELTELYLKHEDVTLKVLTKDMIKKKINPGECKFKILKIHFTRAKCMVELLSEAGVFYKTESYTYQNEDVVFKKIGEKPKKKQDKQSNTK